MRQLPADLPDDPSPEQVNAWVELAELVADESFRQRARSMALAGGHSQRGSPPQARRRAGRCSRTEASPLPGRLRHAGQASRKESPRFPAGKAVLDRIVPPGTPAAHGAPSSEQLETFTDARVERYWQLLAILNGQPVPPSVVPAFEWLIAALRAQPRLAV